MNNIDYGEIDSELVNLIKTLNRVPGLKTTSCCSGHGKMDCMIFIKTKSIQAINDFMWAGCRRWFFVGWDWKMEIENGDTHRYSDSLSLQLRHPVCVNLQDKIDNLTKGIEDYLEWRQESDQHPQKCQCAICSSKMAKNEPQRTL